MDKLETLYKKTSAGGIQSWRTWVMGNKIYTEWGLKDGKLQQSVETISAGKNVGKKNETTPEQQATSEAESRWEKKLKSGYVKSAAGAVAGKVDAVIEGGVFPMLAHIYEDNKKYIKYPAFVQPKLDGHRCMAVVSNGVCTLWSRTRKRINSAPHIVAQIETAVKEHDITDITLDGELYNHEYHDKFEELTSKIRQSEPDDDCTDIQYHVYDVADITLPYSKRRAILASLLKDGYSHLFDVLTYKVADEEEMYDCFYKFIEMNYEGAIYRNGDTNYENKRSRSLLKVKEFKDAEFVVVDIEEGRGKMEGHAVLICRSDTGHDFKVKMAATQEFLRKMFLKKSNYIGKRLTVKYQGLTALGIPRFPVGMRMREDV